MKQITLAALMAIIGAVSAAGADSNPPGLSSLSVPPTDPVAFCKSVLDQGLFDRNELSFNTSAFLLNQQTICKSDYSSFSAAESLKAAGGFDIPGVFGISGSDQQAAQQYSTIWHNYCGASFEDVQNSSSLLSIGQRASSAILNSFDHCIDELGERVVRYVEPTDQGSGFTVWIETHANGVHDLEISGIDMLDNTTGQPINISDCRRNNAPIHLPVKSNGSNQLDVLCSKPKDHSVAVMVTSSAGDVPTVNVPASPPAPPGVADLVTALTGRVQTLEGNVKSLQEDVQRDETNLAQSVLASLPRGTVLLAGQPLSAVPSGWTTCANLNNYLRLSPDQPTQAIPPPGGSLDMSTSLDNNGFTYDGGRPANPGNDSRRSPPSGEHISLPLPAFTYVACIMKQ